MRRVPWDVLLALLAGLGAGLVYAWMLSPLRVTDAAPVALRTDFKEQYRAAIAASFAATGNLPRAQSRLALLQDPDPIQALNAQAQRMLADNNSFAQADQVADLAAALENGSAGLSNPVDPTATAQDVQVSATEPPEAFPPATSDVSISSADTQQPPETEVVVAASTPRPTQTPPPTPGAPFNLTAQDSICDTNLPDNLLQVLVLNSNRRQVAGVKIVITWEGGEESFFTGLKPELGNGYADYVMTPNVTYTVQLAVGSDIAAGLVAPTCQTPGGETFSGGIKLTFQQP